MFGLKKDGQDDALEFGGIPVPETDDSSDGASDDEEMFSIIASYGPTPDPLESLIHFPVLVRASLPVQELDGFIALESGFCASSRHRIINQLHLVGQQGALDLLEPGDTVHDCGIDTDSWVHASEGPSRQTARSESIIFENVEVTFLKLPVTLQVFFSVRVEVPFVIPLSLCCMKNVSPLLFLRIVLDPLSSAWWPLI